MKHIIAATSLTCIICSSAPLVIKIIAGIVLYGQFVLLVARAIGQHMNRESIE